RAAAGTPRGRRAALPGSRSTGPAAPPHGNPRPPYRCTTEHVRVRVIPDTAYTWLTIIFPSSSTFRAWHSTITSYGPVTASTRTTPSIWEMAVATSRALPTSVWIRMYAWTTTRPPSAAGPRLPVKLPYGPAARRVGEDHERQGNG